MGNGKGLLAVFAATAFLPKVLSDMTEARQFIPVRIAILTISDTRTLETDVSGQTLADRVAAAGHHLSARKIVKDDIRAIRHVRSARRPSSRAPARA